MLTLPPQLVLVAAPSGAGKTTIARHLLAQFPQLGVSVSATSRAPRGTEQNGVDYHFLSVATFKKRLQADKFLEHEMVYEGQYYGTLKSELTRLWNKGQIALLDMDVRGALNLKEQYEGAATTLFIQPPSVEALRGRLEKRGTETPASIEVRLAKATYEMSYAPSFDKVVVNDDLETACADAEAHVRRFLCL